VSPSLPPSLRRAIAAMVVLAPCGGVAAAATTTPPKPTTPPPGLTQLQPKDPAASRHLALQQQALDLINAANRDVRKAKPSCNAPVPHPAPSQTHDAPSQPVLDAIAALRRPGTAEDALPDRAIAVPFGGETYVDYTRSVTSAGGKSFYVVIARAVRPVYRPSAACLDAQHARLVELTRHVDAKVRSLALEEFGKMRQGQEQNARQPTTPQDGIYLFSKGKDGVGVASGGGGSDIASFLRAGLVMGSGRNTDSTVTALVPDGVASVTLEYPKRVSRGRWYKPTVYPSAYTRTVAVQQNVLSVHVPRGAMDAFAARMVWRDADGRLVRVVPGPRGA
jgi:hypothetical protein